VFDEKWQQDRPWLHYTDNAMICTLCKKHSVEHGALQGV
jgi:hypothetical protein